MGRRKSVKKRDIIPDPVYNSKLNTRFINKMMYCGKKSTAERIFYRAIEKLGSKIGKSPQEAFENALNNAKPETEVRSRRVGGATYQIPMEIRSQRKEALAIRWIINYARDKGGKTMVDKLSAELEDCYNRVGNTMKKREDTHKMAEANRAFAHFKW